jgi:hypothetical protein
MVVRRSVSILGFVLFYALAASAQTNIGEPVHPFLLTDLNGKVHQANSYKGKILGLYLLGHD